MRSKQKIGIRGATLSLLAAILFAFVCNVADAADKVDQLDFSSQDCTLKEPVYGYTFNFSSLHSDLAHVVSTFSNDVFEFNICGNLTRKCNNESNAAACLRKRDKEYVLGLQHELHYHNGKMYLNYLNGSKCENGTKDSPYYQLHVILSCDYTLDATQLHVTAYADKACSYYINYETPLACLPIPDAVKSNTCSVHDAKTGHTFDLMSLSDVNYRTSDRNGNVFIINVCKPVLYAENAMCPIGSSICHYYPKADLHNRFINYGTVQPQPAIENGQLLLRHESTQRCLNNTSLNYTSVVYFICDKNVKNVHPEFWGEENCTYKFNFLTPSACNDLKPCTAVTQGNEILDFSPLSTLPPHIFQKDKKNYTVAVCQAAGAPCLQNDGACFAENAQTISLGRVNANLRFNQSGSPYLLYENGAKCATSATGEPWTTKIEFVCANNATKDNASGNVSFAGSKDDAVKIIEDSNCQLLIQYQTPYACQKQITCKAKVYVQHGADDSGTGGDEEVDLTPLIAPDDNYEAKVDLPEKMAQQLPPTTKFFLNVCRPLVPQYQLGCAGGSGACMAKVTAAGAPEEEHSLGFPMVSLQPINRTSAQLLYLKGDPCPSDKSTSLSSRIQFGCNMRAGRGQPVLRSIADCEYRFDWETNVICPPHECNFNMETCSIEQDVAGRSLDFRKASFTNNGIVMVKQQNSSSQWALNICGPHRKAITDYSQNLVNIFFIYETSACDKGGTMNVHMRLICSNETQSDSIFTYDTQCNLLYIQRTPSICDFLGMPIATPTPTPTPTSMPTPTPTPKPTPKPTSAPAGGESSTHATPTDAAPVTNAEPAGSVGTILGAILLLTFFTTCMGLFAFSPARRQYVRRLFRRSSSAVQSNEEANLLLEPNGAFTDSDDDMLL